ncbi:condensation domain-containing protein [Kitasatospora cinereorecta]|uniref:condensation domain-containing protein n=1 Tax=Kitasatospora cinereorecta TaxID=285560 RepID=UPI0031F752A1
MVTAPPNPPRTPARADRSAPLPLSSGQQQMWLLHQLAPGGRAYLMNWTLRLTGALDVEALRRAWERITERHEILRTRYEQPGDVPRQLVDPPGPFALRMIDLGGEPAERREQRAEQVADWERGRPFDLTRHHPVRVSLIRTGPEQHLMVVTVHHIACDDDSYRIIAAELAACYAEALTGTPAALAEPAVQYADFAAVEHARSTGGALRAHLDHWRDTLADAPEVPLPLDRPHGAAARPERRAGLVELTIRPETAEGVLGLAAAHRATPFMVLLAAYHVMIGRLTGSRDVTIGMPVSTRTPDLDGLLGYLVNTVVVRSRRADGDSFADLVGQIRGGVLDAFDHRFVPFERVVDEVRPARGPGANPLFRAAFDMEQADEDGAFELTGLRIERLGPTVAPDAKFDLNLHVAAAAGRGLFARLEYDTAVIDEASARTWAAEWAELLDDLIRHPGAPIADGAPRAAAPAADQVPQQRTAGASPAADLTGAMHDIWAEVLELDRIGHQENFFDVGGDSLRAVALAARLRVEGLEVSAADVFAHQSIEELAAWCAEQTAVPGAAELPAAVAPYALIDDRDRAALPEDVVDAYPLTATQLGMIIELRARPDVNTYQDTTSYLVRDEEPVDAAALQQATQLVVDRHEVLRTSFDLNRYSVPLQLVHRAAPITVGVSAHGVLGAGGWRPALEEYAAHERRNPMAITGAPLIRVHAHTAEDAKEWWITITECHPILEGFSFHTMLMEILTGYRELRAGRTPAEPEPVPFRYADYVAAEAAARESQEDRAYWRGVVEGRSDTTLPASWQGDRTLARERYQHMLDFRDLEDDLRRLASETGTSMKAVLLAAHLKVMSAVVAGEDFYTGLVCDARPEAVGADRVLGMYLNTLPFAMPTGARTWGELVRAVYDGLTELWPHRVFPMQVVQQEFGPGGRLLDVFFNYLDFRQVDQSWFDWDATYNDNDNEFALHVFTISGILKVNTTSHRLGRDAADRLTALYRAVLEQLALGPYGDATAACLPAAERDLLGLLDRTGEPGGEVETVLDAFARTVAEQPEAVAVRCGEEVLDFRELSARVREIAVELRADGVRPGSPVTLAPEHGVAPLARLLAAWRVGAAVTEDDTDETHPADTAYLLPGTAVTHRRIAEAVHRVREELAARGAATGPGSTWLCAQPPTSAAGLVDVLVALTSGAAVHLTTAPPAEALDELRTLVAAGGVTHLPATAPVADRVLGPDPAPITVLLTGDGQDGPAAVAALRTRATVVEALTADGRLGHVAYDGRPARGLALRVQDTHGRPLPRGVVGELWAEDADGPRPTGRLARTAADGRVVPLGPPGPYRTRELLGLHPAVLDSRVVELRDEGRPVLVGHVRTVPGADFAPDEIRRALAERRLPRHLIPDTLLAVDHWPLTPAGQVDPDRLPTAADPAEAAPEQDARPWDDGFEDLLLGVLAEASWEGGLDPDVPLADIGLSSMATVGLMVAIEQLYDIVIPDDFQIVDMFRTPRMLWEKITKFRDDA